ncbi:MAG: hypothetical protein AB8B59_02625 [Maribacter sp.]
MKSLIAFFLSTVLFTSCQNTQLQVEEFDSAIENGKLANEAYLRSLRLTKAWLAKRDPESGLIPTNFKNEKDFWEPHNSAADNYAFMVLTAYLLDKDMLNSEMLDMLNTEKKLTSRIKSLPDTYSFSKKDFQTKEPNLNWIVFGSSEYIKDGLLPLNEYMENSPWTDRMMEMLDDLLEVYTVLKGVDQLGRYKVASEEVNGEMLQTLSRIYWMTGDEKYLERAIKIGDYYLLGERDLSTLDYLRLRDHGCEIIGGLSELYVTLHFAQPEKKKKYQQNYYKLLDRVLEIGRNEDGLFYNAVNAATGEVIDEAVVDNWGYTFNAYYSVYLVDGKEEYRQAIFDGIKNLNQKYQNFNWERNSSDGYADALEGGINLFNREPVPSLMEWIDSEIKVMWNMQKEDGIVEGWHGDGNFSRTSIMYGLWKTLGVHCYPWREDLIFGAELGTDNQLQIAITSKDDWEGKLTFDYPRHKEILNLPIDYPRINQFPEWFVAEKSNTYQFISSNPELTGSYSGSDMKAGIPFKITKGEKVLIKVRIE